MNQYPPEYNQQPFNSPGYPYPPQPPKNKNTAAVVAIIIAVGVVILAGMAAFTFIFLNRDTGGTADETTAPSSTAAPTTEAASTAPRVLLPNLKGMSQSDAIAKLTELNIRTSVNEEETDKEKPGHVVRQEPSEGSEVKDGDMVTIYIAKQKETQKPTEKPTQKPTTSPAQSQPDATYLYCTAIDFVSLRSAPDRYSAELAQIPSRASMVYLNNAAGGWYYVRYGSQTGYVSADYVSFSPNSSTNQSADGAVMYCTASDFVALRSGPGESYTLLEKIPNGATMTYLNQKSGRWYYVRFGNKTGYVFDAYVAFK